MQYTAYIYRGLFDTTPIDQIELTKETNIEEQLKSFSTLSFLVSYYKDEDGNLNTQNLQEFLKIRVVGETGSNEELIFEGVIFELNPNFEGMKVNCRDYRGFLEDKRYLTEDKLYTAETSTNILGDLLAGLNAKTSADPYPENWTYIQDEEITGIDGDWKKGTSYFKIFEDMALKMGKSWYIHENGVIKFKTIVGTDKTEGEEYIELSYSATDMAENNIGEIPGVTMQSTITNSLIPEIGSVQDDTTSINQYIRLEEYQRIEGDEITNYLSKSSQPQIIYTLDIKFSELDGTLNIGDKVALRIETGIQHLDIEGEVFITSKKTKIS